MRDLAGLSIYLMGASGGIGGATALKIAKPGVKIAICSVDQKGLDALEAQLKEKGAEVFARFVDNRKPEDVKSFMDDAYAQFGGADILVNFAGLTVDKHLDELTPAELELVLDVNIKGMILSCKYFADHVDTEKGAKIFNFGSMAAKRANALGPQYSAAKAAVNMWTDGYAKQVKAKNISVCCVNPGPVATGFHSVLTDEKRAVFMTPDDAAEVMEFLLTREQKIVVHAIWFECFDFFKGMP